MAYFLDNFGDPLKGKAKLCRRFPEYDVRLYQRARDKFAVVYGKQVEDALSYGAACDKLGQALMHAMACNEDLDNRMPGER